MKLSFDKEKLDKIVLPDFPNMLKEAGQEHYRLLNYIAGSLPDPVLIYDVGSYRGLSALALAYNTDAKVISYDIEDQVEIKSNIEYSYLDIDFKIGNALEDPYLLEADLILLDTYHDGYYENEFYSAIRRDYKGLLLLDDIHLNEQMSNFWNSIEEKKIDLTSVGHYTGTGLVIFG